MHLNPDGHSGTIRASLRHVIGCGDQFEQVDPWHENHSSLSISSSTGDEWVEVRPRESRLLCDFIFSATQLWPQSHALPTYPLPPNTVIILLRPNSTPNFCVPKIGWGGSDPLNLNPPMALERSSGSSLVKEVFMLKVLTFMVANPMKATIEMTLISRFFFFSELPLLTYICLLVCLC